MIENSVKKNQSVNRVIDIIEAMAKNREPIKLNELAKKLGMAASTVYRFLLTLMESGFVKQEEETSKYYLTMKICELANMVHESINIRDIALPVMKKLTMQCQESSCLVIEEDLMAVYIETVDGNDKMIRGFQRIGRRAPLYCTGVGKLFLTQMDEHSLRLVMEKGLKPYTPNTIISEEVLLEELEKIKNEGYAVDNEECELGARCIAAPIKDYSGKIVAAISISGPSFRMTDASILEKKKHVLTAADNISEILGYSKK